MNENCENSISSILSLKELCRTCTTNTAGTDGEGTFKTSVKCIYEPLNDNNGGCGNSIPTIMELLTTLEPQIKIGFLDKLPKIVCMECMEQLQNIYKFMESYRQANERLQKLLKGISNSLEFESTTEKDEHTHVEEFLNEEADASLPVNYDLDIHKEETTININETTTEEMVDIEWTDCGDDSASGIEESNDDLLETVQLPRKPRRNKRCSRVIETKNFEDDNEFNVAEEPEPQMNEDETFTCRECNVVLDSMDKWRHHIRTQHKSKTTAERGKKSYECEFCGKVVKKITEYRNHVRTHTGEEPFLCVECGKSFKVASSLHTHMLRHKGEKNVRCPHCPKKFVCASGLYGHMYVHKKDKPFVCDTCGAAFHMPYMLRKHNLYHKGIKNYPCEYCDLRFVTAEKQRRHMRTHTGEKPYVCHYCDRAFAQSNDCNKHMRQHVGENIYQCDLCPLRFPLARDLRVHFATHKNDNEETRKRNLEARTIEVNNLKIKFGFKKE
ncbi:uncharacterized protein [Musca autumnalis]|uniref:uncharacterized protein n=1 Tax=Musca autumnalis TaxID=221902 RepID=UPI003CE6ACAA